MTKRLEFYKVVPNVQEAMGFEIQASSLEFAQSQHPDAKVTMMRYFIFNCLGQVVGNVKGYTTYKGAQMAFNRHKMQVYLLDLAHCSDLPVNLSGNVTIGKIKHLTVESVK